MIDVHCHLDDERYKDDLEEVIKRSGDLGIEMITNSTSLKSCEANLKIVEKFERVWMGVGIYPNEEGETEDLKKFVNQPKVVCVGEIGLDFKEGIGDEEKRQQIRKFEMLLQMAQDAGVPVEIHNRQAGVEILQSLSHFKIRGLMHSFSQTVDFMYQCLERDLYISFGGVVTFDNPKRVREAAKLVPWERILIETDAPYMTPNPLKGQRNEPLHVKIIAREIAILRGISVEEIEHVSTQNTYRLFEKMKTLHEDNP